MKEQLISFETAKLAKEKGFYYQEDGHYPCYIGSGSLFESSKGFCGTPLFYASTQSLLQKWLREKHFLELAIDPNILSYGYRCGIWDTKTSELIDRTEFLETYEQALEAGLQEALKLI